MTRMTRAVRSSAEIREHAAPTLQALAENDLVDARDQQQRGDSQHEKQRDTFRRGWLVPISKAAKNAMPA